MCIICELNGSDYKSLETASHLTGATIESDTPFIGVLDPTRTDNPYIDGLLSGYKWPEGTTITYGFPRNKEPYPRPYGDADELSTFMRVSTFMQETFDALISGTRTGTFGAMTLTPITGFTNLNLVKNATPDNNTHILIASTAVAETAHAYYPGEIFDVREGDVWLGQYYPEQFYKPATGSYGHMIAMHELGHALGLKHTFEFSGVGDVVVPDDRDFYEYSLMSYNHAPVVDPASDLLAGPEAFSYGYTQTYMMLDIAALQHLYGANYTFRPDETVYTWSQATGETFVNGVAQGRTGNGLVTTSYGLRILQTIWDGGGIDTYDLSNYNSGLLLDLRPGSYSTFSDIQRTQLGYFDGKPYYARGNVYNSLLHNNDPRSLIENAKGGTGNDYIVGNVAANQLWGNDGKDTLTGSAGNDTLNGGNSADTAIFTGAMIDYTIVKNADGSFTVTDARSDGDGHDTLLGIDFAQFRDQVVALIESPAPPTEPPAPPVKPPTEPTEPSVPPIDPHVTPVDPSITLTGTARSETLTGGSGDDRLSGQGGNDVLKGALGADIMAGGSGNDTYYVDNPGDRVIEALNGGTADRVYASISHTLATHVEKLVGTGAEAITLAGNGLSNAITGNAADNRIIGDLGNDTLNGGDGNDRLSGGSGKDTFVFSSKLSKSTNVDVISGFSVKDDTIRLENAIFKKLGTKSGTLNKAYFAISSAAKDGNDFIVYNKAKGVLSYDADGSRGGAAIEFAKVKPGTALTHADFFVV